MLCVLVARARVSCTGPLLGCDRGSLQCRINATDTFDRNYSALTCLIWQALWVLG